MFACHAQFSVVMLTMQVNLEIKFTLWIQQLMKVIFPKGSPRLNNKALYRALYSAWKKAWIPAYTWDK